MTMIAPTPDMPEEVADAIRRAVANIGVTVSEAVEVAGRVMASAVEQATEMICAGECPCCDGGQIEPDWDAADVHYEEDPGDPIYGPPPTYEFLIQAEDWRWLRCCDALDQLLTVIGGDNKAFNERLVESPMYGVDAWRSQVEDSDPPARRAGRIQGEPFVGVVAVERLPRTHR